MSLFSFFTSRDVDQVSQSPEETALVLLSLQDHWPKNFIDRFQSEHSQADEPQPPPKNSPAPKGGKSR